MPAPRISLALTLLMTACATPSTEVLVEASSSGSSAFTLSPPRAYPVKGGTLFFGTACRRSRSIGLTPPRVRLDLFDAGGAVLQSAKAYLPPIGREADQRCSHYRTQVSWTVAPLETVRACFDRGRVCPVRLGVKVPVTPAISASPSAAPTSKP